MAKKTEDFRKEITRALKNAGKYNKSLTMQIDSLAGAMRAHALATQEIDDLEEVTVREVSRYGNEKLSPHPAFKIQRDAQESITKQMKALGLTAEELAGADEDDPLISLTRQVKNSARKNVKIITPIDEP